MKTAAFGVLLASITLVAGLAAGDEPPTTAPASVDNPLFAGWSRCDVGTVVIHEGDVDTAGGARVHVIGTDKLIEKTADSVKVEHQVRVGDRDRPAKTQVIPAKIDADQLKKTGDEDVAAIGKTFKCGVYEIAYAAAGADGDARDQKMTVAISNEVAGGIVRAVMPRAGGGEMTFLVTTVQPPDAKP